MGLDTNNLLGDSQMATLVLSNDGRIRSFAPATTDILSLVESDLGRPLADVARQIAYDNLAADVQEVFHTQRAVEKEVHARDGKCYIVHLLPYCTHDHILDGVVITLVDATRLKRAEAELRRLAIAVTDSNDAIILQNCEGQIIAWNRGAERMYGYSEAEALQLNIAAIIPESRRKEFLRVRKRLIQGLPVEPFETQRTAKDGRTLDVRLTFRAVIGDCGKTEAIAVTQHDITARGQAERLQSGQSRVLELLATGSSLEDVLTQLVRTIQEQTAGMLCSVLIFDPRARSLRHGAAPGLPAEYIRAIDGIVIGPTAGSCGTAVYRRERVIVEDVGTDPRWVQYRALALRHGIRACWSQPVFSSAGQLLGTFAMYYRERRAPGATELELIDKAARWAGFIIESKQAEEKQRWMLRELDHRVNNTLATVLSVAEQTVTDAVSLAEFGESFRGRIRALARMHTALAQNKWEALDLRQLVELTVAPFRRDAATVSVEGSSVAVSPGSVRAIGMALHELATNAAKWGALSTGTGRVQVSWRIEPTSRGHLRINWVESNGPRVARPSRRGFGTTLIEEALRHELGGRARLHFPRTGLRCDLVIPFPGPGGES